MDLSTLKQPKYRISKRWQDTIGCKKRWCQVEEADYILEVSVQEEEVDTQGVQMVDSVTCTDAILKIDKATSTGPELNNGSTSKTQEDLRQTYETLEEQTVALKKELLMATSPSAKLKGDDKQTHFYTGLPSYAVFSSLLSLLSTVVSTQCTASSLSLSEQFLLFLMKLRLAVPHQDLAYRFGIHVTTVGRIFHRWLDIIIYIIYILYIL